MNDEIRRKSEETLRVKHENYVALLYLEQCNLNRHTYLWDGTNVHAYL
jgi:hypothetical protein